MSDFNDRPFVAGSLVGLRAFDIDALGRLRGPSFDQVFKPGENEAKCLTGGSSFRIVGVATCGCYAPTMNPRSFYVSGWDVNRGKEVEPAEPVDPPPHVLAGVDCRCGFYAYFDGRNDYKESGRVAALIEGYGVCTVGSRGFRASKARLIALVEPGSGVSPLTREYLHRNYPDVPFFPKKRDALAAHPLTPPPVPTPDDDDFWTVEAPR